MKYIFFAILIYLMYQFIFNLVVPVYRTTTKFKKGFDEMKDKMREQSNQQPDNKTKASSKPLGDYIDFEEVK